MNQLSGQSINLETTTEMPMIFNPMASCHWKSFQQHFAVKIKKKTMALL